VCGDDALAARVIEELTTTYGEEVTVLVRFREQGQGPRITRLPNVRIIERAELDADAFTAAQEVNWSPAPDLRLRARDRLYVIATRPACPRSCAEPGARLRRPRDRPGAGPDVVRVDANDFESSKPGPPQSFASALPSGQVFPVVLQRHM
jgi:hypothetical protein